MDPKIIKQSVKNLNISDNIINILISNNIKTINQLCKKSKNDLKQLDLLSNEINKVRGDNIIG